MKLKKEYVILAIVIVALAGYLVTRSKNPSGFELPQPEALEKNTVSRLLIVKESENIELVKKDDQWFLEPKGYAADSVKIGNMLNAAGSLALTALVSESGNYERYDLTDDKKIKVSVFTEGRTASEFDIGRAAPTFQHTFVKLAGDSNVYHARGSLNTTFNHSVDSLRDKTVLSFEKESIDTLQIEKDGQSVVLNRKAVEQSEKKDQPEDSTTASQEDQPADPAATSKVQWLNAGGQSADQSAVDRLLSAASSLQCDDFMADDAAKSLTEQKWRLTFKTDQKQFSITTFAGATEEQTQVPALSSNTPYAFRLAQSRVQSIEQHMDALLKPEPEPIPETENQPQEEKAQPE